MLRFILAALAALTLYAIAPRAQAQGTLVPDCAGFVGAPGCAESDGLSMASVPPDPGKWWVHDGRGGWQTGQRHTYRDGDWIAETFYGEQWNSFSVESGWITNLSHVDAEGIDDKMDEMTHEGCNPVNLVSDSGGQSPYFGGGLALPRRDVGNKCWKDTDPIQLPPMVDGFGQPCDRFGIATCDIAPVPLQHVGPIQVAQYQEVLAPLFNSTRALYYVLLFDAAGNHIATLEEDDPARFRHSEAIWNQIVANSGPLVGYSTHGGELFTDKIPKGYRYSNDGVLDLPQAVGCDFTVNPHCSFSKYNTGSGWFVVDTYQMVAAGILPPNPTDEIAWFLVYDGVDPLSKFADAIIKRRPWHFGRIAKGYGNHPGVQADDGTLGTNVVTIGTSQHVADPHHLHHFSTCQRADLDVDGVVSITDYGAWKQCYNGTLPPPDGYYP